MYSDIILQLVVGLIIIILGNAFSFFTLYFLGHVTLNGKRWKGKEKYEKHNSKVNEKRIEEEDDKGDKKENLQQATDSKPVTEELAPSVDATARQTVIKGSASLAKQAPTAKENGIIAQIGGDKDGINVSLLMSLVQKAELSWSNIQILVDSLLKTQLDNPQEVTEGTEGCVDPVIQLKKQFSKKEKVRCKKLKASLTYQNKLKELRAELNSERSRLTGSLKQLEEALNAKITKALTLHTHLQHILESHAAKKQEFARQIKQLQAKINEVDAIIHKNQEDQGRMQGHSQQELVAQCKQHVMQLAQIHKNENLLELRLSQEKMKFEQLLGNHITVTQNQTATFDSSSNEIEMLKQQLSMMQEQFMLLERPLQSLCEFKVRFVEIARQFKEWHRTITDLDHLFKNPHRHEQELQNGDKKSSAIHLEMIKIQKQNKRLKEMQRMQENGQIDNLEFQRFKNNNEVVGACSSLDQSVNGLSSECIEPELPGIDKTLIMDLEPEICSITGIKLAVKSQQDFHNNSFISKLDSDNLHTSAYNGQFINGQQHKNSKKKRKVKQ